MRLLDALTIARGVVVIFGVLLAACGGGKQPTAIDASAVDAIVVDAIADASIDAAGCGPSECTNCIDDDGDGTVDGFDVECSGPFDDLESSFANGIPDGESFDPVRECLFDGNTGAGDDGCQIHVCCELGVQTKADCPIGAATYDPIACPPLGTSTLSQQCYDVCGPKTVPGCDCFGCCTVCDPQTHACFDIELDLFGSPECDASFIGDPTRCHTCVKTDCGHTACGGSTCILCPGQTAADLPPECTAPACPTGTVACDANGRCAGTDYCANGCCITGAL